MAWIELQQSLWTHRKTFALAEALAIDEVHAGGLVARLWCWALDNAQADYEHRRGLLTGVVPRAIAGGAGWKGDASYFFDALIDAGFLEHDGDDTVIHDWWDYSGRLLERRRRDRERKRLAAAKAGKKPRSRAKALPQETQRNSHLTLERVNAENIVTVPTLLTESLNSTVVNAPPTPSLDDGGTEARANGTTGLRALSWSPSRAAPKPKVVERADMESDPLYPALVAAVGVPIGQDSRDKVRTALKDLTAAGVTPGDIAMRAANYHLVMSPGIPISASALVNNWEKCAYAPVTEYDDEQEHREAGAVAWARRYGLIADRPQERGG